MPGDAAVTGVKVSFGDTELVTELKDRNQAKQDYKEAKREGRGAVMVTRESPDVFTVCIAGLEPGQEVRVETSYVQVATAEGNGWSLRIPLTTAPRYVRKDETSSRHAQGQPLELLRDPGHRFRLDLKLRGPYRLESPTHLLSLTPEGDNDLCIRLQGGEVIPDRDCILQWKPRQAADRPALQVWLEADSGAAETYFLATVTPPTAGEAKKVPGEYVLLVDRSGSMDGPKRAAADWAVEKFLLGLGKDDWFTLGLFHNTTRWFSRTLVKAGESNVQGAIAFLRNYTERGGTELGVALEQALQVNRRAEGQSRHLLIITDAEVTDGGRILRLAGDDAKRADRRRISILCIDAAPNAYLALELADRGGGLARFLTSDPGEGDITTALDRIMEFWSRTICTDLRLFASSPLIASDRDVCHIGNGCSYVSLGDLPAGQPVWVAGKVAGPDTPPGDTSPEGLSFCLTLRDGVKGEPLTPDAMQRLASGAGIKSIYGARKLLGLETLIHSRYQGSDLREGLTRLGYDPEQVLFCNKRSGLYPENNQVNETAALRDFIVSESLKYGLPSSEAAFIAVYRRSGKRVEATALVPNALPHGWSGSFDSVCNNSAMPVSSQMSPRSGRKMSRSPMNPATGIIEEIETDDFIVADMKTWSRSASASRHASFIIDGSDKATPVERIIFDGVPHFDGDEMVLFDSSLDKGSLVGGNHRLLAGLQVQFTTGYRRLPEAKDIGLDVKIFIEDMTTPKAIVKLADFVRQDRVRPLNIDISANPRVKVVLSAPADACGGRLPGMVIWLHVR